MKLYVLDTRVVGFVEQAHPTAMRHFHSLSKDDLVATTIITVGECSFPTCAQPCD